MSQNGDEGVTAILNKDVTDDSVVGVSECHE